MLRREDSIIGRRSGSVVVESASHRKMVIRCDCGAVVERPVHFFYKKNLTCGDAVKHPRTPRVRKFSPGDFRYNWHYWHDTCPGWKDALTFITAIGPRQSLNHGLGKITRDIATCGACEQCRALDRPRNVVWVRGGSTSIPVLLDGEYVTRKLAAELTGMTRQAVSKRLDAAVALSTPLSATTLKTRATSADRRKKRPT